MNQITIEKKKLQPIIPIITARNKELFVDPKYISYRKLILEGEELHTAPLAMGKEIDLIGISMCRSLILSGAIDYADMVAPGIRLASIYVKLSRPHDNTEGELVDIVKLDVSKLSGGEFGQSAANNDMVPLLNFAEKLVIDKTAEYPNNSESVIIGRLDDDSSITLDISCKGYIHRETGKCKLEAEILNITELINLTEEEAASQHVPKLISSAEVIGYDLTSCRGSVVNFN